ncbi:Uncharacterised protein [Staphylococcus aureus]|nr:Uncharacterised protein [Staphylococcus aureus]
MANNPLVPPPAQSTKTFVCSVIFEALAASSDTPLAAKIESAFFVSKFAATFSFKSELLSLRPSSSSRISLS